MVDTKDYAEQMKFMLGIYGLWCDELRLTKNKEGNRPKLLVCLVNSLWVYATAHPARRR